MINKLEAVKNQFIRLIKLVDNDEWYHFEIITHFPPFVNRGYNTLPSFKNVENNRVRLFLDYDDEFDEVLFEFILNANKTSPHNQIYFQTLINDYENAKIEISYNRGIVDEFESNLPKSQRGKTKAWYAP